jgi:hypothetical protein
MRSSFGWTIASIYFCLIMRVTIIVLKAQLDSNDATFKFVKESSSDIKEIEHALVIAPKPRKII